jgi:hypothetical protein
MLLLCNVREHTHLLVTFICAGFLSFARRLMQPRQRTCSVPLRMAAGGRFSKIGDASKAKRL